ncbi:hypothetical protein ACFPM3_02835 [Streptomyces coeruleoprunus]|uniref:Secreted protein n=1 Tax=Streptomyces coeruleoprunus TaxID=285563 RepID=A0ABV9XA41_9ACTN
MRTLQRMAAGAVGAGMVASTLVAVTATPAQAADTWCSAARDYKVVAPNEESRPVDGRRIAVRYYNNHVFSVIYGGRSGDRVSMGWNYRGNDTSYWCGAYGGSWPAWSTVPSGKTSAFTAAVPLSSVNWVFARGRLLNNITNYDTGRLYP